MNIIDKNINMADINIKFVATTSQLPNEKGNIRNPERGLVKLLIFFFFF